MSGIQELFNAVREETPLEDLKQKFMGVKVAKLVETCQPEGSLDILHHAILNNNVNAIKAFGCLGYLTKFIDRAYAKIGHFKYLHLAVWLNYDGIVEQLLPEYNPREISEPRVSDKKFCTWYEQLKRLGLYVPCRDISLEEVIQNKHGKGIAELYDYERKKIYYVSAVDIAALRGNINTVKLLLNRSVASVGGENPGLCKRAVELCSYKALVPLVQTNNATKSDLRAALKVALRLKKTRFAHFILDLDIGTGGELDEIHPFHELYMNCSPDASEWVDVPEITLRLIQHGADTNDFKQEAHSVYSPLRVLIARILSQLTRPSGCGTIGCHMECLMLLLKHGANPWLQAEKTEKKYRHNSSWDGDLLTRFSGTSVDALFQDLDVYARHGGFDWDKRDGNGTVVSIYQRFLDHHEADKNSKDGCLYILLGRLGAFHGSSTALPFVNPVKVLLRYGADLEVKDSKGSTPIQCYVISALENHTRKTDPPWMLQAYTTRRSPVLDDILELCMLLRQSTVNQMYSNVEQWIGSFSVTRRGRANPQLVAECNEVLNVLHGYRQRVKSLENICKLQVWSQIGRDKDKLPRLGIPVNLQNIILGLFSY